jgi:hypothetical protein
VNGRGDNLPRCTLSTSVGTLWETDNVVFQKVSKNVSSYQIAIDGVYLNRGVEVVNSIEIVDIIIVEIKD